MLQAGETEACLLRGLKLEGPCDFEQVPSDFEQVPSLRRPWGPPGPAFLLCLSVCMEGQGRGLAMATGFPTCMAGQL